MENIYEKLILPRPEVSLQKNEVEYIYNFLIDNQIKKTIEVGFAYGCSAAYIISATKSKHIVIDPYQLTEWNNIGVFNLKILKLYHLVRLEEDYSHNSLPKLLNEKLMIDFAFIDGLHLFDYTLIEFYYIDLMLSINGFVMFHDTWMPSIRTIESWILTNKTNYIFIGYFSNIMCFKKIGRDNRIWHNFTPFNTKHNF